MSAKNPNSCLPRGQRGFTMLELLIALLIGLFLLGGLSILVQDNKRTFATQSSLAQLQDSERLGMTMMTDIIQQTGYFTNPRLYTLSTALIAQGSIPAGQALYGTGTASGTGTGDMITVRYQTNTGDGILNCTGGSNATGAPKPYANSFSVVVNAAGVSQLVCNMTQGGNAAITVPLVNNVTNLAIYYGVNTSGTGSNVTTYMTGDQINAAGGTNWNNVVSVQVTMTFLNPMYSATNVGQGTQPQYISFQRTIGIMAMTGI